MTGYMKACAFLAAAALGAPVLAGDQADIAKEQPGENAAVSYRRAFALLPRLSKPEQRIVGNFKTASLNEAAAGIIQKSLPALNMLLRGAEAKGCDWSAEKQQGLQALMAHLSPAREITRLACLRARYHLKQGKPQAAIDDLMAALTLGRHVGTDTPMICYLVWIAIESAVIDTTAAHLTALDRTMLKALMERLERVPAGGSLVTMFKAEREYTAKTTPPGHPLYKDAVKLYEELGEIADLPPGEFEKKVKTMRNPLLQSHGPSAVRTSYLGAEARSKTAMLKAAIVVLLEGNEAIKSVKDPYGDGPFAYTKLTTGFRLQGKLMVKSKPVTLTVGPGK